MDIEMNINKYKYHDDNEIPFLHRFLYEIKNLNYDILRDLQTKYKLQYIFNDDTYTVMEIDSKFNWIVGTKIKNGSSFENFDDMYQTFNTEIKKVFIYENGDDFDRHPVDELVEKNLLIKTKNLDIQNYELDYKKILHVLLYHLLIAGTHTYFIGIHDSKTIKWALKYGKNEVLKNDTVYLDSVLLGLDKNYYDLRDHLMELYKEYKNRKNNDLPFKIINDNNSIAYGNIFHMTF